MFDTIEHNCLFDSLHQYGVHEYYLPLIGLLHANQTDNVNDDDSFEMEECDGMVIHVRTALENTAEHSNDEEPLPLAAFITLVCFFLQVASLVHVNIQTRNT